MPKYRKKPVVIEAMQFTGSNDVDIWSWVGPDCEGIDIRDGWVNIYTLEGTITGRTGDWIIRGVKGEFYPIQDEIFRMTYEPA
jgi:hypothetical protein